MLRYFSILLISINFLQPVNAQNGLEKGYIVSNTGDTIQGFIRIDKIKNLNKELYFCRIKGAALEHFLPKDLKSFWISPNLYFESQEVLSKIPKSYMMPQKLFLYRIHEGYVSVFKSVTRASNAFFIKKQGDETVTPLYMSVLKVIENSDTKAKIDTVTEFKVNEYVGEYYWGRNYIDTVKHFFSDWAGYKPHNFDLTEMNIVSQVQAYNRVVHFDFQIEKKVEVKASKFLFTINANLIAPLMPRRDILRIRTLKGSEEVIKSSLNTPYIGGYELGIGLLAKGKNIGLSTELGFGHISKASVSYTAIGFFKDTVSRTIEILAYNYVFLEAKMLFKIAKSSPFVGVKVGLIPPKFDTPILDYQIGYQYQLSRKNAVKMAFDVQAFAVIPRVYSVFLEMGYQYTF